MAPMMRLASLCYWLALLWLTVANGTGGHQQPAESGGSNAAASAAVVEGSCPLEKWSLEERQNRSQVVFTGVIESCQTSDSIDGDDQELHCQRNLAHSSDPNLALNVRIKKVVKGLDRVWEGKLVPVEGLKDPRICPSRVRLRDTRIFLASHVNQPSGDEAAAPDAAATDPPAPYDHQHVDPSGLIRLRLNSSLMAVSLRHLQQLRAFTKGSFRLLFILIFLPSPPFPPYLDGPTWHPPRISISIPLIFVVVVVVAFQNTGALRCHLFMSKGTTSPISVNSHSSTVGRQPNRRITKALLGGDSDSLVFLRLFAKL